LKWFVRRWSGYQICIGPDAEKEGDKYEWCIPLRDTGEFGGLSTTKLTTRAKRTATKAAISLGFNEPFWRNSKGKVTMAQPLHAKHGGQLGTQTDQKKVIEITQAYLDAMKAGKVTVDHIGEIDLGGGRYIRTFVAQEKP
jgi:hypothetical protein